MQPSDGCLHLRPLTPSAPARIFAPQSSYDGERNILFVNFQGHVIQDQDGVDSARRVLAALYQKAGRKMALVANYDGFLIDESLSDSYFAMVEELHEQYYSTATRYTTSAFMRMKLGSSLSSRQGAAHLFETQSEAIEFLRRRAHVLAAEG